MVVVIGKNKEGGRNVQQRMVVDKKGIELNRGVGMGRN